MLVAASLLGSTAASAAAATPQSIDPLVALSVFGTAQSRAAVCAAGAAAVAASAVAAQAPGTGCVLPVVDAPPPAAAVAPPPPHAEVAVAPAVMGGSSVSAIPLLLGLAAIATIAVVVLKRNDNGEIDLPIDGTPISP